MGDLKTLKKVFRIALANDWIKKDPFYGIHFKQEEVDIEFLSCEELDILLNKEFIINKLRIQSVQVQALKGFPKNLPLF